MRKINWAKLERKIDYKKKYERANKRAKKYKEEGKRMRDFWVEEARRYAINSDYWNDRFNKEKHNKNFWRLVSWLLLIALFLIVVL